jgi:outer membrane receptor protein involved in Fe transport
MYHRRAARRHSIFMRKHAVLLCIAYGRVLTCGNRRHICTATGAAMRTDSSRAWDGVLPCALRKQREKADLTLSYRRSLQMPDPRDLNPYTTYIDAQNLSGGNPELEPQRLTSWEFGTNLEVTGLSANVSAFYRASANTVTDARSFAGHVLVTSKQNGGRARAAGVTGSLDWTLNPNVKLGVDGGVYQVLLYTPDLFGQVRQDGIAGYINFRAAYSSADETLSLDAHMQSSAITPLGRVGATSNVNLAWKHALDKTLSLTVSLNDIFDGSRRRYRTDASTFRQTGSDHFVGRRAYAGFTKKF